MCVNKLSTGCFTRKRTFLMNPLVILTTAGNQTWANWGPNSKFVLETSFRALISKSIRSSIMNTTDLRFPAQLELALVNGKFIKTRSCIHKWGNCERWVQLIMLGFIAKLVHSDVIQWWGLLNPYTWNKEFTNPKLSISGICRVQFFLTTSWLMTMAEW